jgi:hypothetical protein
VQSRLAGGRFADRDGHTRVVVERSGPALQPDRCDDWLSRGRPGPGSTTKARARSRGRSVRSR